MNNDKLKETRPFDLAAAKAGAPYACRNGTEATIVKFNGRSTLTPLVGYFGEADIPTAWRADGTHGPDTADFSLVMTPLGYIEGKPVFTGDMLQVGAQTFPAIATDRVFDDARWPEPEKQYPVSGLSWDAALDAIDNVGSRGGLTITEHQVQAIANAALRHAIDSGQVVVSEAHTTSTLPERLAIAKRWTSSEACTEDKLAARDMAVAEAVLREAQKRLLPADRYEHFSQLVAGLDLAAIIAKVQP